MQQDTKNTSEFERWLELMQRKNLAQRKVPPHHIIKYSIKKNDNWSCDSKYDKMDTWCYGNFSQFAYPDPFLKFVYLFVQLCPMWAYVHFLWPLRQVRSLMIVLEAVDSCYNVMKGFSFLSSYTLRNPCTEIPSCIDMHSSNS